MTPDKAAKLAALRQGGSLNSAEWTERSSVDLPSGFSQAHPHLVAARVSGSTEDDVVAVDTGNRQIHVLSTVSGARSIHPSVVTNPASVASAPASLKLLASMTAESAPAAVLPMRLSRHGLNGLVMLQEGQAAPTVMPQDVSPANTFTVTNTLDAIIPAPNAQITGPAGSLRKASLDANNATGPSSIVFNIPITDPGYNSATDTFLVQPLSEAGPNDFNSFALNPINATVIIDGYTQPGASPNEIDYFKTDYTPIVTQCQQTNHRHHYGVDVSYWSTLGYYAVQEALLQKFPDLINEGCSGSGHIKDFGDIQRVHTIAMNDTLSSLPNRQGIYDSSFAFPPAALMDYTYENFYDTVSDAPEAYFWRSSMMNQWQIDPTHSASWTPEQRAGVKRATEIYKSWVRPILQDVEVHHILPRPDGFHWDGMFYWSPSLKRGTLYIFRPNNDQNTELIPLKGLVPETKYKVRTEDHSTPEATYSGNELMTTGLTIHLPGKYTSDLIYLEEVR